MRPINSGLSNALNFMNQRDVRITIRVFCLSSLSSAPHKTLLRTNKRARDSSRLRTLSIFLCFHKLTFGLILVQRPARGLPRVLDHDREPPPPQ
jgi:hypothetical protein